MSGGLTFNCGAELRPLRQWVVWKLERRGDESKPTKVPYDPATGRRASSTEPFSWGGFDEATDAYNKGGYSGIGFMFGNGFAGIDLDECRDPETSEIEEWARDVIRIADSYTEVSPSKTGLHIFCKGKLTGAGINRKVRGHKIEMYDTGRFFTFTGNHLEGTPIEINPRDAQLELLYNRVIELCDLERESKQAKQAKPSLDQPAVSSYLSDSEVMEKAMNAANGAKFERLWGGNISAYDSDESRADLAFVGLLAFWTQDYAQIERLWLQSGLYRKKLDREDYRQRTINHALAHLSETYSSPAIRFAFDDVPKDKTEAYSAIQTRSDLTGREQIICRAFAYWGISDESFRSFIVMRGIFDNRKTARISGALIGRHQRLRDLDKIETAKEAYSLDQRFGNRRKNGLIEELKAAVNYPLLRRIEKSKKIIRKVGGEEISKRLPARYKLDESIFDEAEEIASSHPAMISGSPAYNPGRAREEAALVIAKKYTKHPESTQSPADTEPDPFSTWVKSEKAIWRAAEKIAEAWDDLGKTTGEQMDFADKIATQVKQILLREISSDLRRKRKKNQPVAEMESEFIGSSVTLRNDESQSIADNDRYKPVNNTIADTQKATGKQENSSTVCDGCGAHLDWGSSFCADCGAHYRPEYWQVETGEAFHASD